MPTIHENNVPYKRLPGRDIKLLVGPDTLGSKNMCFGVAIFPPQSQASPHVHEKEEEIMYILSGAGEIIFNGQPEKVYAGMAAFAPVGVEHQIVNKSEEPMKLAFAFSPPVIPGSYDRKK